MTITDWDKQAAPKDLSFYQVKREKTIDKSQTIYKLCFHPEEKDVKQPNRYSVVAKQGYVLHFGAMRKQLSSVKEILTNIFTVQQDQNNE